MGKNLNVRFAFAVLLAASIWLMAPGAANSWDHTSGPEIDHVLLISIDGFHAVDFGNCALGLKPVNGGQPYCPNLAALKHTGTNYVAASASKPSDSFPGLMTLMTGGTPITMGVYYDVAYDRSLNPPMMTSGNGNPGGSCTPGGTPPGTSTEYDEGIDIDHQVKRWCTQR